MPPRDIHFPPQHMRPFRPTLSAPAPPSISPEYRIYDLNKRLSMRNEDCDHQWWEGFVNEFFEEDALVTILICLDDGPKRFNINRILIPRFFRTLFDGGVNDVYFLFKHPREIFHHPTISLDCEQSSMVMQFGKPSFIKLWSEGHFTIEFTFDDLMRIKTWHFTIKQHQELIPRSVVVIPADNPSYLDQLSKNLTRYGLTTSMLNFLRLCEVLEPMQELMSRHKTTTFSPRDCLKTLLHQRWSKTCSDARPPAKTKRKRKSNTTTNNNNTTANLPTNKDSPTNNSPTLIKKRSSTTSISSQNSNSGVNNVPGDVMVVGEPSLMGGEMDDEDERFITRLENNQYDSNPMTQYRSPSQHFSPSYQQTSHLQSSIHPKQQYQPNSTLLQPNQMKREQMSYPGSPAQQQQQQQQLPLPSMFLTNPTTPNSSANANVLTTSINGENSIGGRRISSANNNSPQTIYQNQNPSTPAPFLSNTSNPMNNPSWNGSTTNNNHSSSSSNSNAAMSENKQEPHTPPITPQQTIVTA